MKKNETTPSDLTQSIWKTEKRKSIGIPTHYHESLLMVLWGWIFFLDFFRFYLCKVTGISYDARKVLVYFSTTLVVLGVLYSLFYLSKRLDKLQSSMGKSLIVTWVLSLLCMVMVYVLQIQTMQHVVFELQHVLFMIFTGLAILATGHQIHNRQVFYGGGVFILLAFGATFLKLADQLLVEALGWLIAFVIPGHLLLKKSSKVKTEKSVV